MKRFLLALALCLFLFAPASHAQNFTAVTGCVLDVNGLPYSYGTISAVLTPATPGGYTLGGFPYSGQLALTALDSNGCINGASGVQVGSNAAILPAASQWKFTIGAPGALPPLGTGPQSFTATISISGASQSIGTTLSSAAPALRSTATGTPSSQFNAWDQGAFTAQFSSAILNPPSATTDAFLGIFETNNPAQSIVNAIHGQGTTTNTSGTIGVLGGVAGEADIWSSGSGGVSTAFGTWGFCEVHTAVVGTECDGMYAGVKVDTGAASAQVNGLHIVAPVNTGTITTVCGLCVDNQTGGTTNVWGVKSQSFVTGGSTFAASGCGATTLVGGATAGKYTSVTAGACSVTITMGNGSNAPNGWICKATDLTTAADAGNINQTGGTTSTAILTEGTVVANDVIGFGCQGY